MEKEFDYKQTNDLYGIDFDIESFRNWLERNIEENKELMFVTCDSIECPIATWLSESNTSYKYSDIEVTEYDINFTLYEENDINEIEKYISFNKEKLPEWIYIFVRKVDSLPNKKVTSEDCLNILKEMENG